jgi:hypothetical protein
MVFYCHHLTWLCRLCLQESWHLFLLLLQAAVTCKS